MRISLPRAGAVVSILFFVLAGSVFIPRLGLQQDEMLFSPAALPGSCGQAPGVEVGGTHIPLMLMSYVGALKGWLYKLIFALWEPWVWSIRLPSLLVGAAAIALVSGILTTIAGRVAGLIVAALLASDAAYLLTVTLDWGPVAIQHLLIAASVWTLIRAFRSSSAAWAFACGLAVGLAVWNKAIAVWFLTGLAAATMAGYRRSLLRWIGTRSVAALVAGVVVGAAPLLVYNLADDWPTIRQNARVEKPDFAGKAGMLKITLDGSVMFGYLFPEADEPRGGISLRGSLLPYAVAVAIPAGLALATRETLFLLLAGLGSWIFMVMSGGGGAAHHAVLLAPIPHAIVAIAAARVFGLPGRTVRLAGAAACAAVVLSGCFTIERYRLTAWNSAGGRGWTDAILRMGEELRRHPERWVVLTDWGMHNNLCALAPGTNLIALDPAPEVMTRVLEDADGLAIRSLGDQVFFPATAETLISHARAIGKRIRVAVTVTDSKGQPKFELLDFY
jgi:hypothetical protein